MELQPVKIQGGPGLLLKLKRLKSRQARRIMGNALRSGARLLATESRRRAPVGETGKLKLSITVAAHPKKRDLPGFIAIAVGFKSRVAGFRAHFEEFGRRNQSARPFVRPAFYGNVERILARIIAALRRGIERLLSER